MAHERRMVFHILEDFLSIEMYVNRKKTIQKRVDSIVSPFKKATRDAGQFMAEAPGALLSSLKQQAESVKVLG